MDPAFTDSNTHPRKGKWSKPHKVSRRDKRGPRLDLVSDLSENVIGQEATSAAPAPIPTCTGRVSSLAAIYKEDGYAGYMDYVNADNCTCASCAKQVKINTEWILTNAGVLEEAEAAYVVEMEKEQERREWYDWSYRTRRH